MYTSPATLINDIDALDTAVQHFLAGSIDTVTFKTIRVPMGIYEQRIDGTYMVRIRCTGGFISPQQLQAVCVAAEKYGSGLVHLTTRQEVQIQNVTLPNAVLVLRALLPIGLSSKGGGGNTVRNILASIGTGIDTNEVFDILPHVSALTTRLIAQPDSFTFPRKLKIAFSNSEQDTGFAKFNDLGFIARKQNNEHGFGVYLGGSLGNKPFLGQELFEFIPQKDLFRVVHAVKTLFSQHGNRRNKHKARLRFLFYSLGKDEVFRLFTEYYKNAQSESDYVHSPKQFEINTPTIAPIVPQSADFDVWKKRYVHPQRQTGLNSVLLPFSHGNLKHNNLHEIAGLAALFGSDTIRLAIRQNIHLRNILDAYLPLVFERLRKADVDTTQPVIINNLISCTGADTCRLGICLSKGATAALKSTLQKSTLPLDALQSVRINISGCPNSCGQQTAADLGFFGKAGRTDRLYPAYNVVAGGTIGSDAHLAENLGEVSARDLPAFTVEVLDAYSKVATKYPSFGAYAQAEGKNVIISILDKYKDIPAFSVNANYYVDWGSDAFFTLAARGAGECSAGLFDLIEVDLQKIKVIHENLKTISGNERADALYQLLFLSTRILLITRGDDPRTETVAFDSFIKTFIDTNIVDAHYRNLLVAASNKNAIAEADILAFSAAVIDIYEKLDDSLQIKTKPVETSPKEANRTKDLRGVACPMNFVKTKIELATLPVGSVLEILLDDGAPIQNVPGSVRNEGHKILSQQKVDNHWVVIIEK